MLSNSVLTLLVLLPIGAALLLWTFPSQRGGGGATGFALFAMALELTLALFLAYGISWQQAGDVVSETAAWIPSVGAHWALGLDGWSLLLVLLAALLAPLALLASHHEIGRHPRDFAACLLLLEGGLIGNLLARDLLLFYVFWEAMLLPAFFLIGVWGTERSPRAASRFFLYTMAGSMLLLSALIYVGTVATPPGEQPSFLLSDLQARLGLIDLGIAEGLLFLAFALAFLVKVPVFLLHGWLAEAYVEAPATALPLVSGVMVKLGAVAFLRLALLLFPRAATFCLPTIMALTVVGCLYSAWLAGSQSRLRRVFAFASISHMSMCIFAMTTMTPLALTGSMVLMVSHGINAASLFLLTGMVERRCGSDSFRDLGGLARETPELAFAIVVAGLATIGLPGLNGFVGEFLLLCGSWQATGLGVHMTVGQCALTGIVLLLAFGGLAFLRLAYSIYSLQAPAWRTPSGIVLRLAGGSLALLGLMALVSLPLGPYFGGALTTLLTPLVESRAELVAPNRLATAVIVLSVVLSAVYMLRAIERTCFGRRVATRPLVDFDWRERVAIWPLLLAMVGFGAYPRPILALAEPSAVAWASYFREGAGWMPLSPMGPATEPSASSPPAAAGDARAADQAR